MVFIDPPTDLGSAFREETGDFTTDKRVLVLAAMAVVVSTGSCLSAAASVLLTASVVHCRRSVHRDR